ncbi:MAG: hypothetical protein PHQ43_00125 [Dehalococcoidales bacterium]|nr:hypothetical protein [Dehalococcoidales bacterium]
MAMVDNYIDIPGLKAGEDLSSYQYRAVKLDSTAFQVIKHSNANAPELPIGILQNDPDAAGKPAHVAYCGVCKARYGGNVTLGDSLSIDNDGDLISDAVVADGSAVDLYHIAKALESGADTEIHWVLLYPGQLIGKE